MKYYRLLFEDGKKNHIVGHIEDDFGLEYKLMEANEIIENLEFEFYFEKNKGNKNTDLLANEMGWIVVSEKMLKILTKYCEREDFQIFNVKLIEKNNSTIQYNYYCFHLIKKLDCVNFKKSEYSIVGEEEEEEEKYYSIRKLSIDHEKVKECHLFRPIHFEEGFIISEELKNTLTSSNISGVTYQKLF